MQVSVENVQGLERRMKVSVPLEAVNKVVNSCFQKLAKTARIDGFRPGKVPQRVLEERYGESVRHQEAVPQLVQETLWDAFKQVSLEPAGRPTIENIDFKNNEPLNYSVLFDVLPEFQVKDLAGVEIERVASEVTDADVDKAIEKIRFDNAKWIEITTPAQKDDVVTLSCTVEINGEIVPQEEAKEVSVQLNDKNNPAVISELREHLVGLSAGDTKTIQATYPAEYPAVTVAGKEATFNVSISKVKHAELPELDEAFIQQFDGAKTVEELKKTIRKNMEYYVENAVISINKTVLFAAWAAANPIDLPRAMVHHEMETMTRGFLRNMLKQETVSDQDVQRYMPMLSKLYQKSAAKRVRLALVMGEFLKHNPQEITKEQIQQVAEKRAALYQEPQTWLDEFWADAASQEDITSILREEAVAEWLSNSAVIKTTHLDYFAALEREKTVSRESMFDAQDDGEEGDLGHVHGEHCQHDHHAHDHVHDENCQHDHEHTEGAK